MEHVNDTIKEKPLECKSCPYTAVYPRKYGFTIHCKLEPTLMDVTHVNGRSLLCPLLRDQ